MWFLVGFLLGVAFVCMLDKPIKLHAKQIGYRAAVTDMTQWNCYIRDDGETQFVNVIPLTITDPIERTAWADDRSDTKWNNTTTTFP